jgi:hypothetical protein
MSNSAENRVAEGTSYQQQFLAIEEVVSKRVWSATGPELLKCPICASVIVEFKDAEELTEQKGWSSGVVFCCRFGSMYCPHVFSLNFAHDKGNVLCFWKYEADKYFCFGCKEDFEVEPDGKPECPVCGNVRNKL